MAGIFVVLDRPTAGKAAPQVGSCPTLPSAILKNNTDSLERIVHIFSTEEQFSLMTLIMLVANACVCVWWGVLVCRDGIILK